MADETFYEKFCSICRKMSYDSHAGDYNETHLAGRRAVPCNQQGTMVATNLRTYVSIYYFADGTVKKYGPDGREMELEV